MATKKKGTLTKVGQAVKKATKSVADTADKYVVKPVSKALGVKGKKKKPAARMTGVAKSAKTGSAKKSTAKKTTAKKTATRKK
jgi:DNA-binding protein HU-beta